MTRHSKMQQLIKSCFYPEINTDMSSVTSCKLHLLNTNFQFSFFQDNCFKNVFTVYIDNNINL